MSDIRAALKEMLAELHPETDFETAEALFTDGLLDSFDMVSLIARIRSELGVTITADKIVPENFRSLDTICALVEAVRSV